VAGQADLSITKTDGVTTVTTGGTLTYTIVASNAGPCDVTGATVTDNFPAGLTGCTWTCTGTGCVNPSGSGNINELIDLTSGSSVTFSATCTVTASSGTLSNTATITPPAGVTDPTPANASASDNNTAVQGGGGPSVVEIPTLSSIGLLVLVMALAGLALALLRRRREMQ